MSSVSKKQYIDKLDNTVNKCNNRYHRKPVDVKPRTYVDFAVEINHKNPEFNVRDHLRISKYKNIFAKL